MEITIISESTEEIKTINGAIEQHTLQLIVNEPVSIVPVVINIGAFQGPSGPSGGLLESASSLSSLPTGDVEADTVQEAIAELSAEKARRSYSRTFTQSDLNPNSIFTVIHGFNSYPANVSIRDDRLQQIYPDNVTDLDLYSLSVDLSSFAPITGIYRIVISE